MMTPSAGTKLYEQSFTGGMVLKSVGGRDVKPHMYDGNYVVASIHPRPWKKQLNLLMGYLYFYNPFWFFAILLRKKTRVSQKAAAMQIVGMLGVIQTIRRTFSWAIRLMFGQIERLKEAPGSPLPMRSIDHHPASHAACGPTPPTPKLLVTLRVPKRQREAVH
jgi:hypothetical protein